MLSRDDIVQIFCVFLVFELFVFGYLCEVVVESIVKFTAFDLLFDVGNRVSVSVVENVV